MTFLTTWQFWIVVILLIISSISKAVQDTLSHHYDTSVFRFLNPKWWNEQIAYNNKYTWSSNKFISYLLQNQLVFVTSAWHTFGMLRDLTIFACIPIISQCWWIFLGYPIYRLIFHLLYTYAFIKKQ